jgi:transposase
VNRRARSRAEKSDDIVREHSEAFKSKLVQRMLMPGGPTATALSHEVGISQPTLSRWLREATTLETVTKRRKPPAAPPPRPIAPQRPEDRSAEQKLRLVAEASVLPEAELGEFMRRHGLHEADLAAWREMALGALGAAQAPTARSGDARRVRELEKELRRKDKALAETAALLVLQKKARSIWGDGDDDTKSGSED